MRYRLYLISLCLGAALALAVHLANSSNEAAPPPNKPAVRAQQGDTLPSPTTNICTTPLRLTIGHIDSQFQLSEAQAATILTAAVREWRDATGITWFTIENAPDALRVNFLFDGRQEALSLQLREEQTIEQKLAWAKEHQPVDPQVLEDLLTRLNRYRVRRRQLRTPTPWAQYTRTGNLAAIDIFAFSSEEQLHAILLHELGHALGLEHLPHKEAIMHALREIGVGDTHLAPADIQAALSRCQK